MGNALIYAVIAALVLVTVIFVYRESSGYNIVKYIVETDKDIGTPVSFVMLSDLHDTDVTSDGNARLLGSIRNLHPDFIILAGDMITSYHGPTTGPHAAFPFIKELSGICNVYYGLGNHEQRYKEDPEKFGGRYETLREQMESFGVELLSDEYTDTAGDGIRIYGFNIPIENYRRAVTTKLPEGMLEETFGKVDDKKYNILLAHSPDFFDEYVKFKPDLILSGHLHGGIIAFPGIGGLLSPQLKPFPKYDCGMFSRDGSTMIVSRGIGWHSIPIRIFNKAEIVSVTIVRSKDRGDKDGDQR